jgi:hypothetical protein
MQPRFTSQSSDGRSLTTGKSMTLPDPCVIAHVGIQAGRGSGARFMKKHLPSAPFG